MFFVRTHTSYIVNMDYIRVVRETETELQNGEQTVSTYPSAGNTVLLSAQNI